MFSFISKPSAEAHSFAIERASLVLFLSEKFDKQSSKLSFDEKKLLRCLSNSFFDNFAIFLFNNSNNLLISISLINPSCAAMHRATKPFLVHVCPSIFANTYYRLAGVKMGSDVNITSEDINDPSLTRIGSGTVVGGKAAINGHIVEKGQLVLAPIVIGESCLVGGGSLMMPGSKMEDNSVIGNRTLVPKYKSIPENEVWAGVPARMVSQKSKRD